MVTNWISEICIDEFSNVSCSVRKCRPSSGQRFLGQKSALSSTHWSHPLPTKRLLRLFMAWLDSSISAEFSNWAWWFRSAYSKIMPAWKAVLASSKVETNPPVRKSRRAVFIRLMLALVASTRDDSGTSICREHGRWSSIWHCWMATNNHGVARFSAEEVEYNRRLCAASFILWIQVLWSIWCDGSGWSKNWTECIWDCIRWILVLIRNRLSGTDSGSDVINLSKFAKGLSPLNGILVVICSSLIATGQPADIATVRSNWYV